MWLFACTCMRRDKIIKKSCFTFLPLRFLLWIYLSLTPQSVDYKRSRACLYICRVVSYHVWYVWGRELHVRVQSFVILVILSHFLDSFLFLHFKKKSQKEPFHGLPFRFPTMILLRTCHSTHMYTHSQCLFCLSVLTWRIYSPHPSYVLSNSRRSAVGSSIWSTFE